MLKILIVDDMPIFLEYLRGCIDWENYGFTICAEAKDGKDALEKIEAEYPDVVLSDITMPYIDGLELSEIIAQKYPNIAVILITGNNEFEYARRAVKIGVCDYIVKPFEKEELILSLLKLQDNINRALEMKSEKEELESHKKEIVLRKLILGKHESWEKHSQQFDENGIEFKSDYFIVSTMKFDVTEVDKLEGINNWQSIIIKMLQEKIEMEGHFYVFRDFENNIIIIFNFADENEMKSYKVYELSDIIKIVKESINISATIGISDWCYGLNNVKEAYVQSQQAIMNMDKNSREKVFEYRKMTEVSEKSYYSWNAIDRLNTALQQFDEETIKQVISEEVKRVESLGNPHAMTYIYSGLISVLLTGVINSGRSVETVFGNDFMPYEEMKLLSNAKLREDKMIEYFICFLEFEKANRDSKSHVIVEKIKEYIANNYMDSQLCITDISKEMLVNQTYLRTMFKAETGITITEYITKYRMQIARKMIHETDEKFAVIAEKTGYSDVSYFSKSFKKFFGMSPKDCR